MSYQYNLAGLLTSETYPSNKTFATTYDIAGRIAGVTGPSSKVYAESFTYTAHGAVSQMRSGNQLWEHPNFNNRLQPTEIGIGTGQSGTASVDRLKLNYGYGATDNNGNVKNQTITVPTVSGVTGTTLNQCYTYDEFNRLKIAEEKTGATTCQGTTVWTQKFKYDQQGNRQFDTGTTIPVSFPNVTINAANNNRIDGSQGYLYDFAGNVTQDPSHSYAFDAEERQKTVDGGTTGQYFYDGNGQRVKTITGAGTTLFVYDATGRLVAEYTSGNPVGGGTSYMTADGLGSSRVITAQDKSVKARHDYLPFGEEIPAGVGGRTAPQGFVQDTLRQKFTGKERDIESGLDYFTARYYSSALGRFASADSVFGVVCVVDPARWNRYSYVLNNPLNLTDVNGMWPTHIHDLIIRLALPGLSEDQIRLIRHGSRSVDIPNTIFESHANEHAMRKPGQTLDDALAGYRAFVDENMQTARIYQKNFEAAGYSGVSRDALYAFGQGTHAPTDKTSPAHEGFQVYVGLHLTGSLAMDLTLLYLWRQALKDHSSRESAISSEQLNRAVGVVRDLYLAQMGAAAYQQAVPSMTRGFYSISADGRDVVLRAGNLGTIDIDGRGRQTYRGPLKPVKKPD